MDEKMDLDVLRLILRKSKVPTSAYAIGFAKDDALCIAQKGNSWVVFSVNRGNYYGVHIFDNEDDACRFFLTQIEYFY